MRLGHPLAAASMVAAMTGASLITSPVLANSSNSSDSSTPSSTAEVTALPDKPAQPSLAPSKTGEATLAPGKTAAGSDFKVTQEKTFVSLSTNASFTVSGTSRTGKQVTVGIALYAPDGSVSDVVEIEAATGGSWTSDLDLAVLIKSVDITTAITTDGRTIGAGCMIHGGKIEITQVTRQQQARVHFGDTHTSGSHEVSVCTESRPRAFTSRAQGLYASKKVMALLRSKSDFSVSYALGEPTVDANGNLMGNLPAPTDTPDGGYVLVLTGSHHSKTATSQTVTMVSQHTLTIASSEHSTTKTETSEQRVTENSGGGSKIPEQKTTSDDGDRIPGQGTTENNGGNDKITEQKVIENNDGDDRSTEQRATEDNGGGDKTFEQKTIEDNGGGDKTSEQKTTKRSASEHQSSEQNTTERSISERRGIEQKASEQNTTECSASGNNSDDNKQTGGDKTTEQKVSEKKTTESDGGGNDGGSDSNANAGGDKQAKVDENKVEADRNNNLSSNAKDPFSKDRASGEATKDSGSSLTRTDANDLLFGGIATFLVVAGGTVLVLRRRNKT